MGQTSAIPARPFSRLYVVRCRSCASTAPIHRTEPSLGMGQKQLPAIDVKRAAERHSGRSHAERGNEGSGLSSNREVNPGLSLAAVRGEDRCAARISARLGRDIPFRDGSARQGRSGSAGKRRRSVPDPAKVSAGVRDFPCLQPSQAEAAAPSQSQSNLNRQAIDPKAVQGAMMILALARVRPWLALRFQARNPSAPRRWAREQS